MEPRWKLLVEGLGKIERAEVEVHPLMLFVGENNSGKSYLATLLWGLLALHDDLELPEGPALQACFEWLARRFAEQDESTSYEMTAEDLSLFARLYAEALAHDGSRLVRSIFNTDDIQVSRLELQRSAGATPVRLKLYSDPPKPGFMINEQNIVRGPNRALISYLMGLNAFGSFAVDPYAPVSPIFFPASRTGFMLLYKALVRKQIQELRRTREASDSPVDLTMPTITFLDLLAVGLKPESGLYAEEADFLEAPLNGRIELSTGVSVNEYYFRPAGGNKRLTMALSSSIVAELAPIVLVLRHMKDFPVLILEEPEAHLHPKMQRRLAQTIVRLIRKGLYVWITTHSENFCQQINNFLKIGNSLRRAELQQKLGYGEQDYLTSDDVVGYQFTVQGDRSNVTELKKKKSGLVMPTFNHAITDLSKETLYLQAETAGEG